MFWHGELDPVGETFKPTRTGPSPIHEETYTMPKQPRTKPKSKTNPFSGLPPLHLNAAGIDIGSREHYVAVPPDRDPQPVQTFQSFTCELHRLADWLQACQIDTVAMESTGVYWIPLYQILESRGFQVYLVNAHQIKNVPGRKTDVLDCQWIQKLHTFGLLNSSFRPADEICVLRSYLRQRDNLISSASTCIQHMQKALTEMNIQLANVISDISGQTGLAIIRAIVGGERDAEKLAKMKDYRILASQQTIAKSLQGNWRQEHIFSLRQALALYDTYQSKIAECDHQIRAHLDTLPSNVNTEEKPLPPRKSSKRPHGNSPQFDLRDALYRISGADLTSIDGIDVVTAQTVISEIGLDMTRWKTEKNFASWLGLCPNNRITGGKVIKSRSRHVINRATHALRMAASTLRSSKSALGANFRRLQARLGPPKAITAMAHKLARLVYRILKYGQRYVDKGMQQYEQKFRDQRIKWIKKQAKELNLQIIEQTQ
jgi:transposase